MNVKVVSLRDLRRASNFTLADVAYRLNVSKATVYRYEDGTRQINIKQVLTLASLYDCTEADIIYAQLNSNDSALQQKA